MDDTGERKVAVIMFQNAGYLASTTPFHQSNKPSLETFQIIPFGSLLSCRVQVLEWMERKKSLL